MMFGRFSSQIFSLKASLAFQKGNIQETIDLLGKAYKTGKAKASVVSTYGYMLLKYGKLEEAIKIFTEQLSSSTLSDTDRFNVQSNYALALWKNGQLDDAISLLEKVIAKFKNTNIYGSLGYLYNLKGNLEKALSFNLEAYDYNSTNGIILDNLGETYYLLDDFENAQRVFKELMTLNPKFPEAYYDYALVYEKTGDKEKCIEYLKKAMQYKPNYLSAITAEDIEDRLKKME
ncbi:tetratricopeptide repeat protein [Ruminiclostridium sufflavum DSM 19573]|uniref:Tetratricopeptide repeat protein n=1 Tax=Ruminiclostridium sufflavum DSM 19573 TaxID=1121337 RepID=A0A318XGY1_9FIRM|nr:tetratricopeptide repeat protein [Ruminiclostridium sufflavum]PYG85815.1 tetratricopeptide repeat protein [Ruminiclostridium sufflavum DSM 19573]